MRRIIWLASLAVASTVCGHGGGPLSPSSGPTLLISDAIGVPHSFDIGRTYSLRATLRKPGGADQDVTTASQWASSNNSIATIAGNVVHVQALGEVDVTATYGNAFGTFHISVTAGEIVFQFFSTVSQADQQLIRDAMGFGETYFASTFRWSPTSRVTVMVNPGSNSPTGATNRSTITLSTGTQSWKESSSEGKQRIVLHEFFHVLQLSTGWDWGLPVWLVEGAADYMGFRAAIVDRGFATSDAVRDCHEHYVDANPIARQALSDLEGQQFYDGTRAPYSLGYLAVDELVGTRGLTSLMTFGTKVELSGFSPAFETAFGRPLTAFYSEFGNYRLSWPHTTESACGAWF